MRLIKGAGHLTDQRIDVLDLHSDRAVGDMQMARRGGRDRGLVFRTGKADRKRLHRPTDVTQAGGHTGGIEAAGQEQADGDIGQ